MLNWSYNFIINLMLLLPESDHTLTLFLCLTDELDVTLVNFLFLHLTQMNTSGMFVFFILAQER
jgi:hypothetical protein